MWHPPCSLFGAGPSHSGQTRWQHHVLTGTPWHPRIPFRLAPELRVPSRPDQPGKKLDNWCAKIWGPQNFIWLEMAKETLCTISFFLGQKMSNCSWPRATIKNLYHQIVAQIAYKRSMVTESPFCAY